MHPIMLEIAPFVRQGFCCSQLLILLALGQSGSENSGLTRAMQGLCHGIGQSDGPCGLLTGGACALALLSGRGTAYETPHPMFTPLLNEYASWFYERVAGYGGTNCENVASGLGASVTNTDGTPDPLACGALLAECWDKIREIFQDYELDAKMP
jgi:hypothetical protein